MRSAVRSPLTMLALLVSVASAGAGLVPGGGQSKSDCYLELDVQGIENGTDRVQKGKTVLCTDGEACDSGPCGDNVCTMTMSACVNQTDPNVAACTPPAGLDKVKITGKLNVQVPQLLQGATCSPPVTAAVEAKLNKKGKYVKKKSQQKVKGTAKASKGTKPRTDKDSWTIQCLPRTVACPPPTTTTTTIVTTTTGPTTTTTLPPGSLLFTNGTPVGTCGDVRDGGGTPLKSLTCGGLNLGGGASLVDEGPTPDGGLQLFALDCTGSSCTIGPTSDTPAPNSAAPDCTDTGCNFGTPLPIPNAGIPGLSVCVLNRWAAPASGTVDLDTGAATLNVPLNSTTYLTGVALCPKCSAGGSPSNPGVGTCDSGDNAGQPCTSTNSEGLTRDCPPAMNTIVGTIPVDLSPLVTGSVSDQAADGLFCPGQDAPQVGCFGQPSCRSFMETGVPAGPLSNGVPAAVTLASTFCIPGTGNPAIDGSANLPGPGAVSLPGEFLVAQEVTTTTAPPTTSTTSTSTTTTTATLPPTTSTTTVTSTTDTTSTTGVTTSSTTSTTLTPPTVLDFTNGAATGACGDTRDGGGGVLKTLTCGGLNIGGGTSAISEGPTPAGSVSRFALSCTGTSCTVSPNTTVPGANTAAPDCTNTGCNFGTPLPIPNPSIPAISTCVVNKWAAPASGTLELTTGAADLGISLGSDVYLTGVALCPKCSAGGSPSAPGTGTCMGGAQNGQACTSTNPDGLTRDCLPTAVTFIGTIPVNLSPAVTTTKSSTNATGQFCPNQTVTGAGCFGDAGCRTINENGVPAGALAAGTPSSMTLASTFCIPATGNGAVDGSANLPGPGAVSLPGTFVVN